MPETGKYSVLLYILKVCIMPETGKYSAGQFGPLWQPTVAPSISSKLSVHIYMDLINTGWRWEK